MNFKGMTKDTVFPLMGSMKIPDGVKLDAGIKKTNSKTFQSMIVGMNDRVGITFQKDNRGVPVEQRDTQPYLQVHSFTLKDGTPKVNNMVWCSNKVGVQRDADGKPLSGPDGKPLLKEGKSQVGKIFDAVQTVEVVDTPNGKFMHFAMQSPLIVTRDGDRKLPIPDFNNIQGVKAEAGMGQAQFDATKEARAYAKQQQNQVQAPSAADALSAEAAGMEEQMEAAPSGPEVG